MAIKLLGMAISFSAKDKGAAKTADDIADGLERTDQAVRGINTAARMNKLSAFIQSLSLNKLNQISDKLGEMAGRAGSPEITTGLEQTMITMNKTTRAVTASLGLTGDEARRVQKEWQNLAYQTDIDVGTFAEIGSAVRQTGADLKAYGFTLKDLGKFQDAFGVSGAAIINSLKRLESRYDMTGEQSGQLLNSFIQQAESAGVVKEAMEAFPDMTERVGAAFTKLADKHGVPKAQQMIESIQRMAVVSRKALGRDFSEGIEMGTAIVEKFAGAQKDLERMRAGIGQFPDVTRGFLEAGMDIDQVFSTLKSDPIEFARTMRGAMERMRAAGKDTSFANAFLVRLQETVGDLPQGFTDMIMATGDAGAALDKALASTGSPVDQSRKALQELAKEGHRTTFTLEQVLERAQERFKTRFRKLGRRDVKAFINDQRKAYDDLSKNMEDLVKEGGPLGNFIKKVSVFQQVGLGGLISGTGEWSKKLRALSPILSNMAVKAIPFFTMLGSMGVRPGMIAKPFTLLLKPFGMLNKMLGKMPGKFLAIFGPVGIVLTLLGAFGDKIGPMMEKVFSFVGKDVPKLILKYIFRLPAEELKKLETPGQLWGALASKVWKAMVKGFEWIADNFWKGVEIIWNAAKKAVSFLWGKLTDFWNDESMTFGEKLKKIGKVLLGALTAVFVLSPGFRRKVFSSFKSVFGGMLSRTKAANAAMCAEAQVAQGCMPGAAMPAAGAPGVAAGRSAVTRAALARGPSAGMGMSGLNLAPRTFRGRVFTKIQRGVGRITGGLKKMGSGLAKVGGRAWSAFKPMGRMVGLGVGIGMLSGQFDPLVKKLGMGDRAASTLTDSMGGLVTGAALGGPWGALIGGVLGAIKGLYTAITDADYATKNLGKTVNEQTNKIAGNARVQIDWYEKLKGSASLKKVMEENGKWYRRIGAISDEYSEILHTRTKNVTMNLIRMHKSSFKLMRGVMEEGKSGLRDFRSSVQETVSWYNDTFGKVFGMKMDAKDLMAKIMGPEVMETGAVADMVDQFNRFDKAQERFQKRAGIAQTEKSMEMLRDQVKKMEAAIASVNKDFLTLEKMENAGQLPNNVFDKVAGEMGPALKQMRQDLRYAKDELARVTKEGNKAGKEAVGGSWAIDLARGFEMVANTATKANKGAKDVTATLRRTPVPTTGVGAAMPGGVAGVGGGGATATGDKGTAALISVLQHGFGAMVSAVNNGTKATMDANKKGLTVKLKGGKGAGAAREAVLSGVS